MVGSAIQIQLVILLLELVVTNATLTRLVLLVTLMQFLVAVRGVIICQAVLYHPEYLRRQGTIK